MINKEKAIRIAKTTKQNFIIQNVVEEKNFYIIDMVPNRYNKSMGVFCDGAVKIDKKDGSVSVYNPLIDGE